ncbi:MAG: SH3-like domain-containing protein [Proteobacteria bacterium]|nr:SH3-like domain-containing protein [Pseudomonadota bacterium]
MTRTKTLLTTILAVILMTATYSFAGGMHTGKVLETASGGGYSYMKVNENGKTFWIAGPESSLGTGDTVRFDEQMWMHNFQSKALNRKFDSIMFVGAIGQGSPTGGAKVVKPKSLKPAKKYPIRELFAQKNELNGKAVKVKGKVTKVSSGILGMNWIHIEDGTTYMGNNKIIFTSPNDTAKVGDEVTAQGTLETDKDFGAGYFYPVIVQSSSFSK